MNESTKLKVANALTAIASIVAVIQGLLTTPPFTPDQIVIWAAVLGYVNVVSTVFKQYLSPEVNSNGTKTTIWIAAAATVGGLLSLVNVFHLSEQTSHTIIWIISAVVAVINIMSKQIFPSEFQKQTNETLKNQ